MKTTKMNKVIRTIAKREGVRENEIREEMQRAILMGFMNPSTRQRWDNIFGAGRVPEPEEFIAKISNLVAK